METPPSKHRRLAHSIRFSPGDFVYGLKKARARVVDHLRRTYAESDQICVPYFTVDELNNSLVLKSPDHSSSTRSPLPRRSSRVPHHTQLTPEPLYPGPECKFNSAFKMEYEKYINENVDHLDRTTDEGEKRWLLEACLKAIHFTVFHECNRTIHFVLDDLDLHAVFKPDSTKFYDSFTSHELRYIVDLCVKHPYLVQRRRIRMYKGSRELDLNELNQHITRLAALRS